MRPRGRPAPASRLATGLTVAAGWLLVSAAPALAHTEAGDSAPDVAGARAVAVGASLLAVAVTSGLALPGAGFGGPWRRRLGLAASIAAVALAPAAGLGGPAIAVAAVAATATMVVRDARWLAAATTVLAGAVTAGAAGAIAVQDRLGGAIHVIAAGWWIGAVVEVVLAWRKSPAAGRLAAGRHTTVILGLAAAVVATGVRNVGQHLGDAGLAMTSWWGRALGAKLILLAAGLLVGHLGRRGWSWRIEGTALLAAGVIGTVLAAGGAPLDGPATPGPAFLAATSADVVVTPLTPGRNVVLLRQLDTGSHSRPSVEVDGRRVEAFSGAGGTLVASVTLGAGRHTITAGGQSLRATVRGRPGGAVIPVSWPEDVTDPDCLDLLAGAAAAAQALTASGTPAEVTIGPGPTCAVGGSAGLSWEGAGTSIAAFLAARAAGPSPIVVVDGRARSASLAAEIAAADAGTEVRPAAGFRGAPAGTPVILATSSDDALRAARRQSSAGSELLVLAPWLLDARLLRQLGNSGVPALVSSRRDPTASSAAAYRAATLALPGGGLPPTAAGLEGYLEALAYVSKKPVPAARPSLYGMSKVGILPPSIAGNHSTAGWSPGLALIRVGDG